MPRRRMRSRVKSRTVLPPTAVFAATCSTVLTIGTVYPARGQARSAGGRRACRRCCASGPRRSDAEDELFGDLAIGPPRGGQLGDGALALGQRAGITGAAPVHAVTEAAQLARRHAAPALGAHGVERLGGVGEGGARSGAIP